MEIVYLISIEELKEFGFMHGNVEDSMIAPCLNIVQDTHLMPLLGSKLFDRLIQSVIDGDTTTDEAELIGKYIKPVLVRGVDKELVTPLIFQTKNTGVQRLNPDQVVQITQNERSTLIGQYQSYYDAYAKELIRYLSSGKPKDWWDLYKDNCECNEIAPARTQKQTGLYF